MWERVWGAWGRPLAARRAPPSSLPGSIRDLTHPMLPSKMAMAAPRWVRGRPGRGDAVGGTQQPEGTHVL